ncbi:hypothetical protein ACFQ21_01795 [Ohtaekwangia kribbensis]|jgi:hypothetical protein|uniref:Uncharacterized protein n=1 Tax=Ohtaekwangia kribbensis TaxID=688913 RepID=A0ABW3JYJ2_9BACT
MAIIVLIIVIVHFIHASLLMKTRFNTLKSLLNFIEEERSSLGEKDYKQLVNRYSGITRLYEPFPDRESYSVLYSNEQFANFVQKARKQNRYYLTMTVAGFVALAVIAFWMENNPQ